MPVAPEDAVTPELMFCVEMGMVMRSRRLKHASATSLVDEIVQRLKHYAIAAHARPGSSRRESHKDWTVLEDLKIPDSANHRFGIKIVSPMFLFARHDSWAPKLEKILSVLNYDFETSISHQCATHVHVVPARGAWTLDEAKSLASTAIYFERCFDALMPPYRRKMVWAKSNRFSRYLGKLSLAECLEGIRKRVGSFPALVDIMNTCGAHSPTGVALGSSQDFYHEGYRWNFGGAPNGYGTIEFRQPPGVTDSSEATKWIMLVGCFVMLSCTHYVKAKERPSLVGLGRWVRYQARLCRFPEEHIDSLRRLFNQADQVHVADGAGRDASTISTGDATRLRWISSHDNGGAQKYQAMMNHRRARGHPA